MIHYFSGGETLTFAVLPPLYLPFFNRWGANAYYHYTPFSFDPFTIGASSTSGSPVVLTGRSFFGFLNETGGSFAYDGKGVLTVTAPAGQSLYYTEDGDPYGAWDDYNRIVTEAFPAYTPEPFWSSLEYCTWVDQKNAAERTGTKTMWEPLCEKYVYDYMRRVKALGLPPGKLTIDDGWDTRFAPDGTMCYGNWEIDRRKFPHMERLVHDMREEGFLPGLWFAPFTCTPNSEIGKTYPHLLGGWFGSAESEAARKLCFLHPDPVLLPYYRKMFAPYVAMGFRKFKLDMSYGPKNEMKELLRMIRDVLKDLDPTIECEAHIPDIFVSRYADTVRINDVSFDDEGKWRSVTYEHYKVCRYSAAGRILNLDHIGTNTPCPRPEDYIEHARLLLSLDGGYPCVSLLPDVFDTTVRNEYVSLIRNLS